MKTMILDSNLPLSAVLELAVDRRTKVYRRKSVGYIVLVWCGAKHPIGFRTEF